MNNERRSQPGLAIVTCRAWQLDQRCAAADIPARMLSVQPGAAWPEHRPPVILDTVGLPRHELIALLARPPAYGRSTQGLPAPIMAMADAHDWLALRLLALCPAVWLVCPDDPVLLWDWLQQLDSIGLAQPANAQAIWLVDRPDDCWLDPLVLAILAALPGAIDHKQIAATCSISPSKLFRTLRDVRGALGLPSGEDSRFYPADLAEQIIARLAAPAVRSSSRVGVGGRATEHTERTEYSNALASL